MRNKSSWQSRITCIVACPKAWLDSWTLQVKRGTSSPTYCLSILTKTARKEHFNVLYFCFCFRYLNSSLFVILSKYISGPLLLEIRKDTNCFLWARWKSWTLSMTMVRHIFSQYFIIHSPLIFFLRTITSNFSYSIDLLNWKISVWLREYSLKKTFRGVLGVSLRTINFGILSK